MIMVTVSDHTMRLSHHWHLAIPEHQQHYCAIVCHVFVLILISFAQWLYQYIRLSNLETYVVNSFLSDVLRRALTDVLALVSGGFIALPFAIVSFLFVSSRKYSCRKNVYSYLVQCFLSVWIVGKSYADTIRFADSKVHSHTHTVDAFCEWLIFNVCGLALIAITAGLDFAIKGYIWWSNSHSSVHSLNAQSLDYSWKPTSKYTLFRHVYCLLPLTLPFWHDSSVGSIRGLRRRIDCGRNCNNISASLPIPTSYWYTKVLWYSHLNCRLFICSYSTDSIIGTLMVYSVNTGLLTRYVLLMPIRDAEGVQIIFYPASVLYYAWWQ